MGFGVADTPEVEETLGCRSLPGTSALCVHQGAALTPSSVVRAPPLLPEAGSEMVEILGGMGRECDVDGPQAVRPLGHFQLLS